MLRRPQLIKKPRRVRARRCEQSKTCFPRRQARRGKPFSACKREFCPRKADKILRTAGCSPLPKKAAAFFGSFRAAQHSCAALFFIRLQRASQPPSTARVAPWIYRAPSEHRKAMGSPRSAASAQRPAGMRLRISLYRFSSAWRALVLLVIT